MFPNFMGIEVFDPLNLGMLIFLSLHISAPLLAFRFLQMMKNILQMIAELYENSRKAVVKVLQNFTFSAARV